MPCENVFSSIGGQRRSRIAYTSAQSDQRLRCLQTELLYTVDWFNRGWGKCPDENCVAHVQDDVNSHTLRMLEGTFSLDAVMAS